MGSKKRRSDFVESAEDMDSPVHELKSEPDMNQKKPKKIKSQSKAEEDAKLHSTTTENLNPMERKKRRKILDKEKHRLNSQDKDSQKPFSLNEASTANEISLPSSSSSFPQLHLDHFSNLSSADASVRKGAVEALVCELLEIQKMYRKTGQKGIGQGEIILEAEKDDGMKGWHQDLTYAMGRLIRGASSSRAYSRQGFALGLAVVLSKVPGIKVDTVMKLVVDKIEISSSMKGQEARDCFLGRLFAYGALARSGRIVEECISDEATSHVKNFIDAILSLAVNKHYMREPAAAIILDLIEKLPAEAVSNQVLEAPALNQWFQSAIEIGNPDALLLALKIREKISTDNEKLSSLLPYPFNPNSFFTAEHLSSLLPCFKETTFCQPRVHILWPVLVNMLLPDMSPQEEDQSSGSTSKKHKRSKKCNSSEEEISKNLRAFCEIVVEETLLLSSHDRKHLAFEILLLLLPRMSFSYVPIFLSNRLVLCLMDVLSTPKSWLYKAAQHFLKELSEWIGDDDNRRVEVVVALQTHGYGRFDCITRTHTVKDLVAGFNSCSGCEVFVQRLQKVFLDVCHVTDEPSDQSQTTDENSDTGSPQDKGFPAPSGGSDFLKNWVIDSLPRILKNSKLDHEAKHYLQIEIVEFLTVQGLFSASLGTEVTSFELQKKFQWPKVTTSSALCRMCIEQLQMLLADAQKIVGTHVTMRGFEPNDLGLRFMHLLGPLCNIPSVSLFRPLNSEDDKAFKKLQAMESRLTYEERNQGPGPTSSKIHAMRYLLIQLLLQVLLRPGEFSEAALELTICCKKAFFSHPDLLDDSGEEDEFDKNGAPELMDVLVDTLLSLLPQSSSSMCSAVEQVFRCFCHEITDAGLLRMLRVIKKDLKHGRHQPVNDSAEEDDDEEDLLDVEEAEEIEEDEEEPEVVDTGDSDDHVEEGSVAVLQQVETPNGEDPGSDDESDDGMDDDAMFRMDTYLVRIFKERKNSAAGETAHSQLVLFKLRVLSLLEIYLQKNSGKPQVMTIFSYLVQAFINSHSGESTDQLGQRIGGILQRKLFKAKEYPKGDQIQISTLETLLEKSLNIASRSRHKMVYSLAKNSTFWILKIMHAKNLSESDLQKTVESFQQVLLDYFDSKKCRLKAAFLKEVFLRHSWLGQKMFGHLLKKCDAAKSEYRQIKALDLVEAILKSCVSNKSDGDDGTSKVKFVKNHLPLLAELIGDLLIKPLQKSRKTDVRKFCTRTFRILQTLNLKESFVKVLNPDSFAAFESQSGEVLADAKRTSK